MTLNIAAISIAIILFVNGCAFKKPDGPGRGEGVQPIVNAIHAAAHSVQGTVVGAKLDQVNKRFVYKITIVGGDNKESQVLIDAQTGQIIPTQAVK